MFQLLFQRCMDSCTVAQLWKHSKVVPIAKKSSVKAMNDLRPVALTSLMIKAMERFIKKLIITVNDLLMDPLQFVNHSSRGVDDAKTLIMDTVHKHLEHLNTTARVLFADLSAFNTLQPHILAENLSTWLHLR